MINYNSIANSVFKYVSFMLKTVCHDSTDVNYALKSFVKDMQGLIVTSVTKQKLAGYNYPFMDEVVKKLGEDCTPQSKLTLDEYSIMLKQCEKEDFRLSFISYYVAFATSMPLSFKLPWTQDLDFVNKVKTEVKVENPHALNCMRILFQKQMYPSLQPYLLTKTDFTYFLDFDGTISNVDTCNVGIRGNSLFFEDSIDRTTLYRQLLQRYNDGYAAEFDRLLECPTLSEFLQGFDTIDYDCLKPCEDSGLFKGLKKYAVEMTGRLIDLSENAAFFLKHQKQSGLYVVSQSWYNEMLCNCLCDNVWDGPFPLLRSHIFSSSLEYDEQNVATGKLNKLCGGCEHKRQVFESIPCSTKKVAIGDSLGDLSVLLKSDLPIVLHPSNSFLQVCKRYQVPLKPLLGCGEVEKGVIYTAADWSEICAVLCWPLMVCDGVGPAEAKRRSDGCSVEACRLMALTNDRLNAEGGEEMEEAIIESVEGGATMVQIRDKTENFERMVEHANQLKGVLKSYGVPLIINDRVDVAIVSDADGVHIGQSDMDAGLCRRLLGPHKILGVSAQTHDQAVKAELDGADYLGTGAVFPTISKDDADAVGLDGLKAVCDSVSIPVVSIGGVNAVNAASTIDAGADGIAVISAIFNRKDIRMASRELRNAVDSAL